MAGMEIMAPAGGFQSALQAFEHGADAVYFGLKEFSARAKAENFTIEQLRRLRSYADATGKRLYAALNTIIKDEELPGILHTVYELSLLGIDGIIIQDLGLFSVIHRMFPHLSVHSSTQIPAASVQAVRYLSDIGFSRVVLARELRLEEIAEIRRQCPDVELKVFIHGALCYSVSGMCLASGRLLGRSANRGECAQICRTYFSWDQRDGYYFSMKDLCAGDLITALEEIGIDSVKIEGRMKSPEYAAYTSAYYHSLVNKKRDNRLRKLADTAFSRQQSPGWMDDWKTPDIRGHHHRLTNPEFPGHTGIPAGSVFSVDHSRIGIELSEDLALHDGLQVIHTEAVPHTSKAFPVSRITDTSGKRLLNARTGSRVYINSVEGISEGMELRLVSRHDMQFKLVNEKSLPFYTEAISCRIILHETSVICNIDIPEIGLKDFRFTSGLLVDESRSPRNIEDIFRKALYTRDEQYRTCITEISVDNRTRYDDRGIFIPPRELKQLKRTLYTELEIGITQHIKRQTASLLSSPKRSSGAGILPERSSIPQDGTLIDGRYYLPLDFLDFRQAESDARMEEKIASIASAYPDAQIVVGIQHTAQIAWYRKQKGLSCYIDYYLYCANRFTLDFLLDQLPGCIGAYYWIEDRISQAHIDKIPWSLPVKRVDDLLSPPLFLSRSCFARDSLGISCSSCTHRRHDFTISQNGRTYHVRVRDCMSHLYEVGKKRP
jgi:putative protease